LNDFLQARKAADPDHFPDLSLAVIKLMGPGEYVLERPGEPSPGHFGLAVQNYTHSTAPNRRFADVVTQRLIKSALGGKAAVPYSDDELSAIALNCTQKEDAARKVERTMTKRIAAVNMMHRIGEMFDAIVTGVTPKGTFVRVVAPHVEGLLVHGQGVDVGDKLRVKLVSADPQRGYIDFVRA
jgi:exoribonuclease-2